MKFGVAMEGNEEEMERALSRAVCEAKTDRFIYVEVGTNAGDTLLGMAKLLRDRKVASTLIGIELPEDPKGLLASAPEKFGEFLAPDSPVVVIFVLEPSPEAFNLLDRSLRFNLVLIDACHCEACVMRDFKTVEPLMAYHGRVIFHDVSHSQQGASQGPAGNYHGTDVIQVRSALQKLGLLDNSRPGWVKEADLPHLYSGIAVFQNYGTGRVDLEKVKS